MPTGDTETTSWGWENTGPVWGARAFAPKSGQDHLGLGSVSSDRILPTLAPGINVLTIHPRYWSFYSWVLDDFWGTDLPRSRNAFQDFYRPREALFAMACHVCVAPEHASLVANIVGSRRISSVAHEAEFDPQFDYIKEPLGGYGLYYRSAMELTGALAVARPSNGLPFDAPTPAGRALADAFRTAVAGTSLANSLSDDLPASVPREDLVEFARSACLCQLRVAVDHDLPLLRDLFLHAGSSSETASRSETFRFLLDLSSSRQSDGIREVDFRQLSYFRALDNSTYEPRRELVDVARRWRAYQGREYFAYVFNRLLRWVSRRGLLETDDGLTPIPTQRLWDVVADALNSGADDPDMGWPLSPVNSSTRVRDLISELKRSVSVGPSADSVWPRDYAVDEHALYEACRYDVDDGSTLVALLSIVLLLRERFGLPDRTAEFHGEQALLAEGGTLRIGMARFMHLLNQRLLRDPTIADLLRWLIEDLVLVQHERVAAAKLPDDTYRFRRVGGDIRFFPQDAPAFFNDSRFRAISTMVHELGWVTTFAEPRRKLSASGHALLNHGDLPTGALATAAAPYEPQSPASP